jgi:Asp-tRNA(Asn)/Glu-tRNA(Gln) amidotransferase A subunit family amidase
MNERFKLHSIHAILEGYRTRSLAPTDVARWAIAEYEKREPALHAWECFDPERLLDAARACQARLVRGEPLRALEGIPVGVKDIFNTSAFPTQMGSPLWKGFTPGNDARVLYDVQREGGILPGKTVTAEFAVHALGKTINPHAPDRTPGTSSSGSAVAVASGMVPVALGTQTAGSIVRPASFCGIWGCKPSFGLVPRTGMLKTTDSLDTVGYFVAHASDLRPVFESIRVHGRNFPISNAALTDEVRQAAPVGRPWRVAFIRPHIWTHAEPYAVAAVQEWCGRLAAAGCEVTEPRLPVGLEESHLVHATIYNRSLAYYFQEEYKKAELISPVMIRMIEDGRNIPNEAYLAALDRQTELSKAMDGFFADFDIIVTLSTAGEAPPRDQEEPPDSALIWTLTHLPAVSAPVFRSPTGLPFGLQLVARRYNDPLLMRFIEGLVAQGLLPQGSMHA